MTNVKERYTPYPIAVNGTLVLGGQSIGGFICSVAGTITITSAGVTLLDTHPVSAGAYLPLPLYLRAPGGATITLAGGARGTILA